MGVFFELIVQTVVRTYGDPAVEFYVFQYRHKDNYRLIYSVSPE